MRSLSSVSIATVGLLIAFSARAEEASTPSPEPAPPPAPDLRPSPTPAPSLDFTLLEERPSGRAGDPALDAAVASRRKRLSVHQAAGIATWALMAATVWVGQLNYHDLYGGGGYTEDYRGAHRALAWTTTASFTATGILALSAPEPYAKRARLDTATVHKVSMAVATLGIVAQIALGIRARESLGTLDQRDLAAAHQIVGYATLGAMTIGAVTLAF